jgi:hypothetical protein
LDESANSREREREREREGRRGKERIDSWVIKQVVKLGNDLCITKYPIGVHSYKKQKCTICVDAKLALYNSAQKDTAKQLGNILFYL